VYLLLNIHSTVVDSLKPTEIIVSFSSLSYWNEPPVVTTKDEAKTPMKLNVRDNKGDRDSRLGDIPSESNFQPDAQPHVTANTGNTCGSFIYGFFQLYRHYIS